MSSANSNSNNSFKKLAETEENQFAQPSPQIKQNIMGTARNISFFGNVIELYFSKALGMISALFGGTDLPVEHSENTDILRDGNFDNDDTVEPGGRAN